MTSQFSKQYTSPSDLVVLLQDRGLLIADTTKAESYVTNIGYYRLSGYLYPFLAMPKELHRFKSGSRMDDAVALYKFDKKLRLLLFNEIEKIEIAVRSAIANIAAKELDDRFWMTNPASYANAPMFTRTKALIDTEYSKSKEEFIQHFRNTYSDPYPPAWELIEILPLGVVTRIYENIADFSVQKKIAKRFALNIPVFKSWMTIVTLTRNACCHHARVWNKANTIQSLTMRNPGRPWINPTINRLRIFYDLCIIKWFIDIISPGNDMKQHLKDLLAAYPMVDIRAMGFPDSWEEEPLWR